jgi:hypothetical protein
MNAIPPYLTPAQIAEACRDPLLTVTTRSIRRKLDRAGILEPDGPHRWHVAASRLAE